jgi:hypothetical protein
VLTCWSGLADTVARSLAGTADLIAGRTLPTMPDRDRVALIWLICR